jgi:hypothetical protein
MRHVRDVIRLKSAGMPIREIARRVGAAPSTVRSTIRRFGAAGLTWPLRDDDSDTVLEDRLFRQRGSRSRHPAGPSPPGRAGLGSGAPRTPAQARDAVDRVGEIHRGRVRRVTKANCHPVSRKFVDVCPARLCLPRTHFLTSDQIGHEKTPAIIARRVRRLANGPPAIQRQPVVEKVRLEFAGQDRRSVRTKRCERAFQCFDGAPVVECGIRGKAATDSDGRRPSIPIERDHPIRSKAATLLIG